MQRTEFAWQPLTPGGVASFARARPGHLYGVQVVISFLAALVLVWFLATAWFPVIKEAVRQLPAGSRIESGKLEWAGAPAQLLAENHFLSIAVDLAHQRQVRAPAHVQVEFGQSGVRLISLLGVMEAGYPRGRVIGLSPSELVPWWGAWSPALLAIAGLGTMALLLVTWFVLGWLYCPVAWLIAFFADRELGLGGARRLCGAAPLPAALFLVAALLLYGLGVLDVVRLLVAFAMHFVVGWVYVVAAPFWCPRLPEAATVKGNPFNAAETSRDLPESKAAAETPAGAPDSTPAHPRDPATPKPADAGASGDSNGSRPVRH